MAEFETCRDKKCPIDGAKHAHPVLAFDLKAIKPARGQMDGSGKFSPNLYRWVKNFCERYPGRRGPDVYRAKDGALWIGHMGTEGWFHGARLNRILTRGQRQEMWAIQPVQAKGFKPLPRFWAEYQRSGRCSLDRSHTTYWASDEQRWAVKGKTRTCQWCGRVKQRLRIRTKVTRTVEKKWVRV